MSDKTETLSFDDALNEHKRLLTESLVNFDEGKRVRRIMLDIDSNSSDYEYYFQSGQQSKQAKVDELQKRIDIALDYVFGLYCTGDLDTEHLENILKGENND